MNSRFRKVSKIAQILTLQKELLEYQVREISHRQNTEQRRLMHLEGELSEKITHFEEESYQRTILNKEEVTYLFGMASHFFQRINKKQREIEQIEKELEAVRVLFGEAYQKKKAVDIVKNKIADQEERVDEILEQKNLDYLSIVSRSRQ